MTGLLQLAALRLKAASRWPETRTWAFAGAAATAYLLLALPIALGAGLIEPASHASLPEVVALALRVLALPALVEEVLFRVLLNPHPSEVAERSKVLAAAVLSLTAYVLAHPLMGLLSGASTPFTGPAFLLLTALLGAACLLLYRRSGSLWPPVLLHWLVVTGWLALGGQGLLPGG